ncbi:MULTISPECIES: HAD family hydrolase [unclassified Methanoregula]|uniref:HAD family hydrolase n=1 Tax=unclassified Methanoregula TaxID=2649730 RepID=UPI0009CE6B7A|nr:MULTISPECIES: HAD family hydrolase [unclassified Methanoregula]OPX64156.1 MAG: putative HAD-hydrolase [Methanoregula sp. PtaB.Bin085]OPY34724.1 MAG: putative HAD-hydrolase [Methanoregula sp. PtaU1.Bin006]
MITTVFFDLDDTLFDHQYSRRCGFSVLKEMLPALSSADIHEMELFHEQLIWANFEKVLTGELPLADAITERICRVCARFGQSLAPEDIPETVRRYDAGYQKNRRIIPGGRELLERLHDEVQVGIITNGFGSIQREKITCLEISTLIDIVVISEETGYRKPDKRIFKKALALAGSGAAETIYVGDSWNIDIVPASVYGMNAVWLNRYALPCPDPSVAREITSYEGLDVRELLDDY